MPAVSSVRPACFGPQGIELIATGRQQMDLADSQHAVRRWISSAGLGVNAGAYTAVDKAESDELAQAVNAGAPVPS